MNDKIDIFCPICAKERHKKKKLLEVDPKASGVIYPYCKLCHCNVKVKLVPKSRKDET